MLTLNTCGKIVPQEFRHENCSETWGLGWFLSSEHKVRLNSERKQIY